MKVLKLSLLFVISLLTAWAKENQPNILMISIDDLNDWIGCMGNDNAFTPNIDRLANQGTLFTRTYNQFPLCGPSRASVFSGLYPTNNGIYGHIRDEVVSDMAASKGIRLMHEYFTDHGYKTMAVGKLMHHHVTEGSVDQSGGREPFGPRLKFKWHQIGTSTDWGAHPESNEETADYRSAKWAIDRLSEEHDRPFMLMVGFLRPHVPWYAPQEWFDLHSELTDQNLPPYDPNDLNDIPKTAIPIDPNYPNYPTTEWAIRNNQWRDIVQAYHASVSFVDYCVGLVLDALKESSYAENTIIVLWSDHGYHLGEKGLFKKVTLWERSLHVPLIFAGPGITKAHTREDVSELVDIYPTLIDLADLKPVAQLDGTSLFSPESNKSNSYGFSVCYEGNYSIITQDYHYIRYKDNAEELYHLKEDPHEHDNLIKVVEHSKALEDMRSVLNKRLQVLK